MNSFEPLEITAWMRTRVIADAWLPFDAFLYYQACREKFGVQELTIPGAQNNAEFVDLPMAKVNVGRNDWYYMASWAEWGPHKDYQDYWNKRFDFNLGSSLIDFKGKRGSIQIQRGEFKAYHMTVFCRSALWIKWYCVGDKERIALLLSTLTNIGKKGSQGEGRVFKWEVRQIDDDFSVWKDGKLMRGIPLVEAKSGDIIKYGIRPSYWDQKNQMPLVVP